MMPFDPDQMVELPFEWGLFALLAVFALFLVVRGTMFLCRLIIGRKRPERTPRKEDA